MSLHLHRAERADTLAAALGAVLTTPLGDPFATEIVAVPTRGVERWLAQRLSHHLGTGASDDGICAGVDFPSPRRLVAQALADAWGEEAGHDPWAPERVVWPLLRVIDESRGQLWAAILWSYLGDPYAAADPGAEPDPVRIGRRWSTAQRVGRLFAQYAASRPAMIDGWDEGRDVDGAGEPLDASLAWQPQLWRRLRDHLGVAAPTRRLRGATDRIAADAAVVRLPERLSVFGATRIDPTHLAVLDALARLREVHLWLPHPSPVSWSGVATRLGEGALRVGPRSLDPTVGHDAHQLLGYLGRDSRELQVALRARTRIDSDEHHPRRPALAPASAPGHDRVSLLEQLQQDLVDDRGPRPVDERSELEPDDHSVGVHACHGPDRQVEVLREVLVGLLADDPTLEPRDVIVMCPDIERFAPLISAAFGLDSEEGTAEHPGHRLRVRLADRSLRQLNPLLSVLARVLDLADARLTASSLLDLAAMPPVARQFGFTEDDLERLTELVTQAGVRWGLDANHRTRYGMGEFAQNTWAAGMDRMLLGVAMDEQDEHFIGTALPLDGVESSDVDRVGRFAELLQRVRTAIARLTARQPASAWVAASRETITALTAVNRTDSWQLGHAYAELGRLAPDLVEDDPSLTLTEMRALLGDAFQGRASRANFRTGTLTVATLLPMRSVPHRVVCLLGVDDTVFPRRGRPDGDDVLALDPYVGDRDSRSEDRQLLLDAVLAATERLVVIFSGADPRTGVPREPAVPVGALLDALDLTARTSDGRPVRDRITVRHTLQPFDPANFVEGGQRVGASVEPARTTGRSFDQAALRGAQVARRPRRAPVDPWRVALLPPASTEVVELVDLVRFFGHPATALLRTRAGLSLWEDDPVPDVIPTALDGLQAWSIGDRLLQRHLHGVDLDRLAASEWRRGTLPPRSFGDRALTPVLEQVAQVAAAAGPYLGTEPGDLDLEVLAGSATVVGTVAPLHADRLVLVGYSRLGAKQRLAAWIQLLALTAARPDRPWQAVSVGRAGTSVLGPVPGGFAELVLGDLVDLYRTGLRAPLPFAPRTSATYAEIRKKDRSVELFRRKLEQDWAMDVDEVWRRLVGPGLRDLMEAPSVTEEERGQLAEPTRFGTLARRVFHPLLSCEELS